MLILLFFVFWSEGDVFRGVFFVFKDFVCDVWFFWGGGGVIFWFGIGWLIILFFWVGIIGRIGFWFCIGYNGGVIWLTSGGGVVWFKVGINDGGVVW